MTLTCGFCAAVFRGQPDRKYCSVACSRKARVGTETMPEIRRFIRKVIVTDSCWLWSGAIDRYGYGRFDSPAKARKAHRVSHELFIGPIPEGFHVDHLCRVRNCVRPQHLEAVTPAVNYERANCAAFGGKKKSACPRGHKYDRVAPDGQQRCSQCERARGARRAAAARAARLAAAGVVAVL